jgi:hypothetical protein
VEGDSLGGRDWRSPVPLDREAGMANVAAAALRLPGEEMARLQSLRF